MQRERIRSLLSQSTEEGRPATVCGWVRSKRVSKKFAFVVINDGSCQESLQLVIDAGSAAYEALDLVGTGASVRADGRLKASQGRGQAWELHTEELEVMGEAPAETYPLQKKGHSLEFLREISHLRVRTNTFGAVFRVRNVLAQSVHQFFSERGFVWAHTPIITGNDCEGAGEMFAVSTFDFGDVPRDDGKVSYDKDFFGAPAYLTVSGQLEAEAMAMGLADVYTFGPTFRAENSHTTRHLAEFWMVEPEMAFADLRDNMVLAEDFLRHCWRAVLGACQAELTFLAGHYATDIEGLAKLAEEPFARLSYTAAIEELQRSPEEFTFAPEWGNPLQTEHERYLAENVFRRPVIVTDYPKSFTPFYMRLNSDERTVANMDVLVPKVGELIGGSQREERLEVLEARMREGGVADAGLWWYRDLRRYGTCPHAGFGLGFERLVQFVTGMPNIRDVIPFPRTPQTLDF